MDDYQEFKNLINNLNIDDLNHLKARYLAVDVIDEDLRKKITIIEEIIQTKI